MARNASGKLKVVHQLYQFLEMSDLTTAMHALVTSCLDYCNILNMRLPLNSVWKLHLVKKAAVRPLLLTESM